MFRVQARMPEVTEVNGKRKQKLGKPEVMTFKNRAEFMKYQNGLLKGARVTILNPEIPNTLLNNPMMQRACGIRA